MRVSVGFTPAEQVAAPVVVVVDVLRATSTICQALAAGWGRVVCVGEIEDARALAGPGVALAGERSNLPIDGFDFGNSPRELVDAAAGESLVLTTTNGTRALLVAADRCQTVLVGSLLNLDSVVAEAVRAGQDVAILCAGVEGSFAIDDAYVAGRIAAALGGTHDDSAIAATRLAARSRTPRRGWGGGGARGRGGGAGRGHAANIRTANLDDDIPWCARESVLDVTPRVVERAERAVVVSA